MMMMHMLYHRMHMFLDLLVHWHMYYDLLLLLMTTIAGGEYNKLIEVKIFRGLYKCTQLVSPEHRQRAPPEQPRSIASATANKLKI